VPATSLFKSKRSAHNISRLSRASRCRLPQPPETQMSLHLPEHHFARVQAAKIPSARQKRRTGCSRPERWPPQCALRRCQAGSVGELRWLLQAPFCGRCSLLSACSRFSLVDALRICACLHRYCAKHRALAQDWNDNRCERARNCVQNPHSVDPSSWRRGVAAQRRAAFVAEGLRLQEAAASAETDGVQWDSGA
jgi:hypothetical protein